MMRLYQPRLHSVLLANFQLLILITFSMHQTSQFQIENSQNQQQTSKQKSHMKCYISLNEEDEDVWRLAECSKQEHWCIKLIESDNDFQIRDCDSGYCDSFGERCGPGEEANSSSILPKSTLCCCRGFGCNKGDGHSAHHLLYLIPLFSFFSFQYF